MKNAFKGGIHFLKHMIPCRKTFRVTVSYILKVEKLFARVMT